MKQKKLKTIVIVLSGIVFTGLQAQEALPASGGNASGSGGTANYTVGQVVYTTKAGSNGSMSQGVQQPYEISVVTGLNSPQDGSFQCMVYPNPATDIIIIKIEGEIRTQYVMSLYDMNGKLLESKNISGIETSFDMKNLLPATYFLKVTDGNEDLKTFKIIKTQ